MLIYNHKKEFLGISESDLKTFGFSDFEEFQSLTHDFADLFLKTPGCIHNFQHIHWIDYIICSDSDTQHKATLKAKDKEYTITITIDTIYLLEDPLQKAYCVNLGSTKKQTATAAKTPAPIQTPEAIQQISMQKEKESNFGFDMPAIKKMQSIQVHDVDDHKDSDRFSNYVYNLQKASDALGLPINLVAEFLEDYTAQANSFKEELYLSLQNDDFTTLKTQTHKLIGVAENLRIENALDVLAKISKSQNQEALKLYLDRYFQIIDELSNKREVKIVHEAHETNPHSAEEAQEHLTLSFKEDTNVTAAKTATPLDRNDLLPLEFKE